MDCTTLLLTVGLLLLTIVLFLICRSEIANKINKIPGPTPLPIIGNSLPFLFLKRRDIFAFVQSLQIPYRSIFRIWIGKEPYIHLVRPEEVEVILKNSDNIDKGGYYTLLHRWLGTGLLTSTGMKWQAHRKMITPTFHFKILDSFVEVFSEKSEILVNKLHKEVGSEGFDVYPYIAKCALDIICETAMGTPIYAQDDRGAEYVKAVHDMSELIMKRVFQPWLRLDFLFKFTKSGKRYEECLKILHGFTNKVIAERKSILMGQVNGSGSITNDEDTSIGKKERKTFLDLLLEATTQGVKLTDEELREEVDTFMFEGHDTTSAGMCWALFLMGLHPDVQEEAYKEQETIFQGSKRSVTMKDLNEMKYLERVIKETLRLYPSVPTIMRTLTSDVVIGEYEVPARSNIIMHIYNVHRSPDHFPDPEKFDPDNFLPERMVNRHPYAYIPFSAGPRNCIGQKFALLEEKTILSYILRNYIVTSLDTRNKITLMGELILRAEKGIKLTIKPRKQNSDD